MTADLRLGRWQDVLALPDPVTVDAIVTDPPYSERTHAKQCHGRRNPKYADGWVSARAFGYEHLTPADVAEFCNAWATRCRGWIAVLTDSELYPHWRDGFQASGRLVFAPLPCVMRGMNVRLAGDGPSSWAVWLVVARPRRKPWNTWGTLPGAYVGSPGANRAALAVAGAKPSWLMRAIIRDYTRPGDLVCDPFAGGGTTALAALSEHRRFVGAECNPDTYAAARARLDAGYQADLFAGSAV